MTTELRTMVEPSDIRALEFECLNCRAKQTVLLSQWKNPNGKCANCLNSWPQSHALAFQSLLHLVESLAEISKINGDNQISFNVRLELVSDPQKSKS